MLLLFSLLIHGSPKTTSALSHALIGKYVGGVVGDAVIDAVGARVGASVWEKTSAQQRVGRRAVLVLVHSFGNRLENRLVAATVTVWVKGKGHSKLVDVHVRTLSGHLVKRVGKRKDFKD